MVCVQAQFARVKPVNCYAMDRVEKAFVVSHFRRIMSSEFKLPMRHIGQFYV